MFKYLYTFKWTKDGPELDTFYHINLEYTNEELMVLKTIDKEEADKLIKDTISSLLAIDMRARFNSMSQHIVKSEVELSFEQWNQFLKVEHKRDPESKWFKEEYI